MNNNKVITANLNEMIFEGRNQAYGAYQIRKTFNRRMVISLVTISALILLLVGLAWFSPVKTNVMDGLSDGMHTLMDIPVLPEPEPVDVAIVPPVEQEKEEPAVVEPEPEKPEDTGMDTEKAQVPVPDDKTTADNSVTENKNFEGKNPDTETNEGNKGNTIGTKPGDNLNPVIPRDTMPKVMEPGVDDFHPGKMPEALNLDQIKTKVSYPATLREFGMEGKVVFRVLVGPDGNYVRHVVKRSSHKEFTKACEAQLKNLKFSPGEENGKPVKVWVTIPFKFSLSK